MHSLVPLSQPLTRIAQSTEFAVVVAVALAVGRSNHLVAVVYNIQDLVVADRDDAVDVVAADMDDIDIADDQDKLHL